LFVVPTEKFYARQIGSCSFGKASTVGSGIRRIFI
jgi:hypothetical protein